jgi:hypothetical protein
MKRCPSLLLAAALLIQAQEPRPPSPHPESEEIKLPNGRNQKDEILKADHAKNVEDAQRLSELADQLKKDLEKNTQYVFSVDDLKKTEEMEKLIKRIRTRMKRY